MPQVSAAVSRSTPSSTSASARIRRAAALFFSPLAALRRSEAVKSSRVIDTAAPIDTAPQKAASSQNFTDLGIPNESQFRAVGINPPRCQRITVSGRTIAREPYILGNSRQTPPNINLSIETNRSLLGLARRSTLICCLSTRISASSATRDRNRSLAIAKINRHKSSIGYQHRAILSQLPARLNLRQGQVSYASGGDASQVRSIHLRPPRSRRH